MTEPTYVLLVEDNDDDAALIQIAFEEIRFPHRLVRATDGAQALDFLFAAGRHAARQKHDTPALVILDLKLPFVHGLDVLRALRADPLLKHLVAVVLTSSAEEKDKLQAELLGANLFIQKPSNFDEFAGVARRIDDLLSVYTR